MIKQVFASIVAFGLLGAASTAVAGDKAGNVVMPAESIKWEDGPVKGTHVAKLWGDWMKGGPYGVLVKFDAGVMHPIHHHSQTLKTVIISGTFVFKPEGGTEAKLGPGSYLKQMGNKKHESGCAAGAECVFFMSSNDKFDYLDDSGAGDKKDGDAKADKK